MKVPFLDLAAAIAEHREDFDAAWRRVTSRGAFVLGDEVAAFEREFADYCGARHCIGVASGLDALRLVFEGARVVPGDEVIVPAYTAVATWMATTSVGAQPVGVDVDARTFNLDPALVERAITERTRAIVAVHLFGKPADMAALKAIAAKHDLLLLEDAAQAHGAAIDGHRTGSLAHAAAFSFYPTKNLGCFGDGGAVTTDDDELAERVRLLRSYGWRDRSVSEIFGVNSRLDELQAAFLRVRLAALDADNERRRRLARLYREALEGVEGLELPVESDQSVDVWHVYASQVSDRPAVVGNLSASGVGTLVHYEPIPHLTPAYRAIGWKRGDFPVAEQLASRELSLPMYPQLTDGALDAIVAAIRS